MAVEEGGRVFEEEEDRWEEGFCSPSDEQSWRRKTVHSSSLRDCSFSTESEGRKKGRLELITVHVIDHEIPDNTSLPDTQDTTPEYAGAERVLGSNRPWGLFRIWERRRTSHNELWYEQSALIVTSFLRNHFHHFLIQCSTNWSTLHWGKSTEKS